MSHIFISYKQDDDVRQFIDALSGYLKDEGFDVWWDDMLSHGEWRLIIEEKLNTCFVVVPIITPNAKNSLYMTYEWSYALGKGKKVLPIIYAGEHKDFPARLSDFQGVDFRDKSTYLKNMRKLINDLKIIRENDEKKSGEIAQYVQNLITVWKHEIQQPRKSPILPEDLILIARRLKILDLHDYNDLMTLLVQQRNEILSDDKKKL
jgi:hypothetical protein